MKNNRSRSTKEDLAHFFANQSVSKESPVSFFPSKNLTEQEFLSSDEIRRRYDGLRISHNERSEDLFEIEQGNEVKCYDKHIALILIKANYLPGNFVQWLLKCCE